MNLNFKSGGHGMAFVILHGLFGSLDNWAGIARALEEHFHVFVVDLRNHGRSPHSSTMTYDEMAEDLLEFMAAHQIKNAHLMGHSMGGKVAMRFAQLYPERLLSLIVVDVSPKEYPPEHREILQALTGLDLRAFAQRSHFEEALAPAIPDLAVRRFLLKNLERDSEGRFRWRMALDFLAKNYDQLTQALTAHISYRGPTLFLRGELSDYLVPEDQVLIRRLFPRAETRVVCRASHWVHADNPDQFLAEVLRFTGGNGAPDKSRT